MLDSDWVNLAHELEIGDSDINIIKSQYPENDPQQALVMLRLWMQSAGNKATGNTLERCLRTIGRVDIVNQCIFNIEPVTDDKEKAVAKAQITHSPQTLRKDEGDAVLNRDASMDVSYDEHDLMKEAESAEEEDDNQKSYPAGKGRKDLSPTYESEEKKYAAEEKIVKEEKVSQKQEKVPPKQTITQELVEEFMKESEDPLAEKIKEARSKDKLPEEFIGKTEVIEETFTKSKVEKAREEPQVTKEDIKRELSEECSSTKKDDVPEKEIIETKTTTTNKYEDGSQSIITTKTTERKSWVVDDGSDGEVQEKIVVETRADSIKSTPADEKTKNDMLLKLGAELGKLDDQLDEKFNEKRKTEQLNEAAAVKTPEAKEAEVTVQSPLKPITSYQIVSHEFEISAPTEEKSDAKPLAQEVQTKTEADVLSQSPTESKTVEIESVSKDEVQTESHKVSSEPEATVAKTVSDDIPKEIESNFPEESSVSTGIVSAADHVAIDIKPETVPAECALIIPEAEVSHEKTSNDISEKEETVPNIKSDIVTDSVEVTEEIITKIESIPSDVESSNVTVIKEDSISSDAQSSLKSDPRIDESQKPKDATEFSIVDYEESETIRGIDSEHIVDAKSEKESVTDSVPTATTNVTSKEEPKSTGEVTQPSSEDKMSAVVEEAIVPEVSPSSAQLQQQPNQQPTEVDAKSANTGSVPEKQDTHPQSPSAPTIRITNELYIRPHATSSNELSERITAVTSSLESTLDSIATANKNLDDSGRHLDEDNEHLMMKDSPRWEEEEIQSDEKAKAIKAEIKLLVKTTELGKESIEIRSIREFVDVDEKTPGGFGSMVSPVPTAIVQDEIPETGERVFTLHRTPSPGRSPSPRFVRPPDKCKNTSYDTEDSSDEFNLMSQVRDIEGSSSKNTSRNKKKRQGKKK